MSNDELLALLARSRTVLERYMFDGEAMRDDVAEVCMAIDDVLPTRDEVGADRADALRRSAA